VLPDPKKFMMLQMVVVEGQQDTHPTGTKLTETDVS
jgi:hypothetical protein